MDGSPSVARQPVHPRAGGEQASLDVIDLTHAVAQSRFLPESRTRSLLTWLIPLRPSVCSNCCKADESQAGEISGHLAGYTTNREMRAHAVGVDLNECPACEMNLGTLDHEECCSLLQRNRLRG